MRTKLTLVYAFSEKEKKIEEKKENKN